MLVKLIVNVDAAVGRRKSAPGPLVLVAIEFTTEMLPRSPGAIPPNMNPAGAMPLGRDPSGLTFLRCPLIGHTHKVGGVSLVSVSAREAY